MYFLPSKLTIMRKVLISAYFLFACSYLLSSTADISVFSSSNGYAVIPDHFKITNYNSKKPANFNYGSPANLPDGNYLLQVYKQGYSGCETYFSVKDKNISIKIFLDPLTPDPLLKSDRIKQLIKKDNSLILGYAVDDITGAPLAGVNIKDEKTGINTVTNTMGYFEFYLPSKCDIKTTADISFSAAGYSGRDFNDYEITPETDYIFTVRMKRSSSLLPQING